MEQGDVIWEGKIGTTPLRVGVPHSECIIAEWDSPRGPRHKIADSLEEFERAVLFQLLLGAGVTDENVTQEVVRAVQAAQEARPKPASDPSAQRRRKNPKQRQHRRSRRPPRRR
ncbi:MAG: hypothetical protein M3N53_00955 [Actinomycetota bacterium]|nr:hypothetical protein [Actinomycetota bacterium]